MKHHVFLSYAREDSVTMLRLRDDLRAEEILVWTDEFLEAGTPEWERVIEAAIEDTGCLVVLLSPDSKESKWVLREISYAETFDKRIIPLLVRGDSRNAVPARLITHQYIKISNDYLSAKSELIIAICNYLGIESKTHKQGNLRIEAEISSLPLEYIGDISAPLQTPNRTRLRLIAGGIGGIGVLLLVFLVTILGGELIKPLPTPTSTPDFTATVQQSHVYATATATAVQVWLDRARIPVKRNADWMPVMWTDVYGVDMVLVPSGDFLMGTAEVEIEGVFQLCQQEMNNGCQREWFEVEAPQTHTAFDAPFWIDRTEVTNAQYRRCVDAGACTPPANSIFYDDVAYADHPVVYVSWFQASRYAHWRDGRLPTEAEWEYAGRGPSGWTYPWGNTFDGTRANFCDSSCELDWRDTDVDDGYTLTAPVDNYPRGGSWVGALDMSGNVLEWTINIYQPYPFSIFRKDSALGDYADRTYALRGGSWNGIDNYLRLAGRYKNSPSNSDINWGFRVLRVIPK